MKFLNLHLLPPILSFLILLNHFQLCLCSDDLDWYDQCGNYFTCGKLTKVGFPFWGGGSRLKKCGYPELELTCESNATTKIVIKGMEYDVLDFNQNTQVLRIARDDFVHGICLQKFTNTTLDFDLFDYALGSQNVTVLYGCPPPYSSILGQFTCRVDGTDDIDGYPELGALGPSGCAASVVVPVLGSLASQIGNQTLDQVIRQGFEVKYKVGNEAVCMDCEASWGRCGFDVTKKKTSCLCPNGSVGNAPCNTTATSGSTPKKTHRIGQVVLTRTKIAMLAVFSTSGVCIFIVLAFYVQRSFSSINQILTFFPHQGKQDIEDFLRDYGSISPKRYTYGYLKRITNSFKDKVGEGGYGMVYKGKLQNGDIVAIKILKKPKGQAEEFINEVATVGRTNHINIVRLLGFCYEGQRQALVYEFMPNGSLEKFVYGKSNLQRLAWEKLFQIAIGVARGLEYLHRGCNTRMVHFDIKPHNILLDEHFCPKISDFGLAKPCPRRESIISMSLARGTVGYIAPEVFLRSFGGVSHKSDVYSYGMLVLEMVGCRNNNVDTAECTGEQYFPEWIFKQLKQGEGLGHQEMMSIEERELQRKMVLASLWCIQTNRTSRPNMTRVVEMLEGTELITFPPAPFVGSPPRSEHGSWTTAPTISIP